ncbi:MAG TPA: hypothetical protein VEQ37_17735 [Actinomycetota bacterium]|nr:hypothetical protein [Actinomycetota bacterium]
MRKPVFLVRGPVVGLALLAACTGPGTPEGGSPSRSPAPSEVSTTTLSPTGYYVRTCEQKVYGDLGKDWRDRSVVVGPIAFVGLPFAATAPRREFVPDKDGFKSVKALAVVDRGTEVTVSVPRDDRGHLALLYDPEAFNSRQIADGDTEVTFRACPKGDPSFPGPTQFNGSFIVDGPQCATLEVRVGDGLLRRVDVSLGRGTCAGSA